MPDLLQVARDCEAFGAQGITVHPRPDERHIRFDDVLALAPILTTEFNIEGYPDARYMELIKLARPAQATLVPDKPGQLTSDAGWDIEKNLDFLRDIVDELHAQGCRVSLFVNADPRQAALAAKTHADRIELYTGPYAAQYPQDKDSAIRPFVEASKAALAAGLGLNAGHDLNLDNLAWFADHIPDLQEVSIGHAIVCDALYFGLENTIQMYLARLS